MAIPAPFIYQEPAITINSTDALCHFSQIAVLPQMEWADIETYCNPGGQAPGRTTWTCNLTVRMSYGTDSAWEFFSNLVGQKATFVVKPESGTTTIANPAATFDAYIPPLPFIPEHQIGQSATFTLECRVVGAPVVATS